MGKTRGFVEFKNEDDIEGIPIGPVWIRGKKQSEWLSKPEAIRRARNLDLEFREI